MLFIRILGRKSISLKRKKTSGALSQSEASEFMKVPWHAKPESE
jgi:hypothetical protein